MIRLVVSKSIVYQVNCGSRGTKRHLRALIVCAAAIWNSLKMKFLQLGEINTTTLVFIKYKQTPIYRICRTNSYTDVNTAYLCESSERCWKMLWFCAEHLRAQSIDMVFSGVLLWSISIHSHCGYFHSRFRMVFAQLIHNIVVIMIIIIIMRLFFKKNLNIILLIHVCVHVLFLCMYHLWMDGWIFEPLHNLSMFIFSWRNKCYAYEIGLLDATFISHDFHFSRNRVERNIMGSGYPYQCIEQCHKSHKMNKTTMY